MIAEDNSKEEEFMTNKVEKLSCGQANAYLVRGAKGSILIDTGTDQYREKIVHACKEASVKLIVLTHGHFDHCQNAAYLAEKLDCPVGIGNEDVSLLCDGEKRKVYGKGIWGHIYAQAANWNIWHKKLPPIKPEVILEDGMSLAGYGVDGKIVALPGHTAGSVGVLLKTGELFVGDAMQNILSAASTWCYEDYESAKRSTNNIRMIKAKKIYYGHGRESDPLEVRKKQR